MDKQEINPSNATVLEALFSLALGSSAEQRSPRKVTGRMLLKLLQAKVQKWKLSLQYPMFYLGELTLGQMVVY